MADVKCSVASCSYNKEGGCYVTELNIGGKGSKEGCHTCCGSFLNRQHYSNLAEYTSMRGGIDTINCNVNTCTHNEQHKCSLPGIEVGGGREAEIYTETECRSFNKQ